MASEAELLVASKPCGQCLTTRDRIVSGERAASIISECRETGTHFQCHKGSMAGLNVHCRGVHDRCGSRAYAMARAFGIPIREVDADDFDRAATMGGSDD